jgi:hypothetical protein
LCVMHFLWRDLIVKNFFCEISGKSTLHIVALSNVKWFDEWKNTQKVKKRGLDYDTFKKTLGDALLERALQYLPQLRDKVGYIKET